MQTNPRWRPRPGLAKAALGGILESESGGWFCVGAFWQESDVSCREDFSTLNLVYNEMLQMFVLSMRLVNMMQQTLLKFNTKKFHFRQR
jgi:hypothetical protein